jgi:hypothetical protein
MENLTYTIVQILHNFGAVTVVGSPIAGWWLERKNLAVHRLTLLALLGWMAQGATGIGFALTSYTFKGAIPEVTGIALAALLIKVFATLIGFVAAILIFKKGRQWQSRTRIRTWQSMLFLSLSALTAAGFLRWYL